MARIFSGWRVPAWHVLSLPISAATAQLSYREVRHLPAGSRVLDVGIGTGRTARLMSPRFRVDGVDISQDMLDTARTRLPSSVRLTRATASALPFPAAAFDAAIYNHVLRYMPWRDTDRMLLEARRVLRPGGVLIVSDLALPRLRPGGQRVEGSLDAIVLGIWALFSPQEFAAYARPKGFALRRTLHPLLSFMLVFDAPGLG